MEARPSHSPTFSDFFGDASSAALKKKLYEVLTSDDYADLRADARTVLGGIRLAGAARPVADQITSLLDHPIVDALRDVYARSHVLERYLDPAAYDRNEVVLVEMAQHTVEIRHSPRLEVVVDGQAVGALVLDVAADLEMKALIFKIRDARIWEITPGTCQGRGAVSFYGKKLIEKQTAVFALPAIASERGIPIAP